MDEEVKKKVGRPKKTITDYIVVWEIGRDVFENQVKEKIKEGYVPFGGVSHGGFTSEGTVVLIQSMVKEK